MRRAQYFVEAGLGFSFQEWRDGAKVPVRRSESRFHFSAIGAGRLAQTPQEGARPDGSENRPV